MNCCIKALILLVFLLGFAIPAAAQDIVVDPSDFTAEKMNQALEKKGKSWVKGQVKGAAKDYIFATGQSDTMQSILEAAATRATEGEGKDVRRDCKGAVMGMASSILLDLGYKTNVKTAGKTMFDTTMKMAGLASGFGGAAAEGGAIDWLLKQYTDAAIGKGEDSVFEGIKKIFIAEKKPQFEVYENDGTKGTCNWKLRAVWDVVHGTYSVLITGNCHCAWIGNAGVDKQRLGEWWIAFKGNLKPKIDPKTQTASWVVLPVEGPNSMTFDAQCDCSSKELKQPFVEKRVACPASGRPLTPDEKEQIKSQIAEKEKARNAIADAQKDTAANREAAERAIAYDKEHPKADPEAQKREVAKDQKRYDDAKEEEYQHQAEDQKLIQEIDRLKKQLASGTTEAPPKAAGDVSYPADPFAARILQIHNLERAAVGSPPLQWNPQLAADAAAYARNIAITGQLVHAPREGRGIVRENLQQGLIGWGADRLVQDWVREKGDYVAGNFPNVARDGNWMNVAHYTQMIWGTTTDVGCGTAAGGRFSWLVCRYSPGGNKDGKPVVPLTLDVARPPCPEDDAF